MTLNESLLWSFARCVIIASIAVGPVAILVARIEASPTVWSRRLRLLLAVFPLFLPELLIGFNYRLTVTQLTSGTSPLTAAICTEGLYSLLMLCRCMAVGVALSMLMPRRNAADESLHSWVLLRNGMMSGTWWAGWLRLKIFGAWQAPLVAWSVMALVAFQEFETAALMQIDRYPISWSVWLFDAHAARLPLWDSLRMMAGPLLCELMMLGPALYVLLNTPMADGSGLVCDHGLSSGPSVWKSVRFSALLTPGIVLFGLWPLIHNALPIVRGGMLMLDNATFKQSLVQILTSTGFAVGATVMSMGIALRICNGIGERHGASRRFAERFQEQIPVANAIPLRRVLWMCLLLPGLLGSLVLSLGLLALFQLPGLRGLYDTWLPLLLGQTLAVLPFAVAVVLLLMRVSDPAALQAAKLLAMSEESGVRRQMAAIRWRLTTSRWLLGGLIIAHRCFWDVTVASILRPVEVEPVITRLYNEMHYGRTEALMSLSILAALTPLAIAATAMLLSRLATVAASSR
jgi:ABC-type spermidine/putrescine transport system permease subunit II